MLTVTAYILIVVQTSRNHVLVGVNVLILYELLLVSLALGHSCHVLSIENLSIFIYIIPYDHLF